MENVSRRVDKASLLLNRYLIDRLSQDKPLPNLGKDNQTFYAHLLNIGIGDCRTPADGLEDVWNACLGCSISSDCCDFKTQSGRLARRGYRSHQTWIARRLRGFLPISAPPDV